MLQTPDCFRLLLLCVVLFLNLLDTSFALITIQDIAGNYTLEIRTLNVCADSAEIRGRASIIASGVLVARSLLFDGKACSIGRFPLEVIPGFSTWNEVTKAKLGIVVRGISPQLLCESFNLSHTQIYFTRPVADIKVNSTGLSSKRRKGVKYFSIRSGDGSCLYHEKNTKPKSTLNQEILEPDKGSLPMDKNEKKILITPAPESSRPGSTADPPEKKKENAWVLLGPVLGAMATLTGAIITACARPLRGS